MSTINALAPYDPAREGWENFMGRFDFFIRSQAIANIDDDRTKAIFLSNCGPEVYDAARTLAEPRTLLAIPWPDLKGVLLAHFAPLSSKLVMRHEFRHRMQKAGESFNEFVRVLRKIAAQAEFASTDEAMIDQIIFGVRDLRLQRRLLANPNLTLQNALDEARAAETTSSAADTLQRFAGSAATERAAAGVNYGRCDLSSEEGEGDSEDAAICLTSKGGKEQRRNCASCGERHLRTACRFRDAICNRCGKKGHIAKVCRAAEPSETAPELPALKAAATKKQRGNREQGKQRKLAGAADTFLIKINNNKQAAAGKIKVIVAIGGHDCTMEVDSGSSISIISWAVLKKLLPAVKKADLRFQHLRVCDYQGNRLPVLGTLSVPVRFNSYEGVLPITVVGGALPSLLGLEWFSALGLGITGINSITPHWSSSLINEFKDIFDSQLGKYTGKPVSINIDPMVTPIRLKPRRVPFALRPKLDAALDKLIAQGILVPTDHANWETPIVTPLKKDGSIRICADYKCTLNRALQNHSYPVPVIQHLLHSLGAGRIFAKLDLAQAYQQIPVDSRTASAQTIVTHRGAFKVTRLQFGISVAPGIFQSVMERLLHNIPGVVPYFDDVLVTAEDPDQLVSRLRQLFATFRRAGLKLRLDKCQIGVPEVEFLGYKVDGAGIHPTKDKVEAVRNAPVPKSKAELQSFLGLINFYHAFLKDKATVADPLHRLLSKKAVWVWGHAENKAFLALKQLLSSEQVLIRYNSMLPLVLTCDASPFGIGAVLSHSLPSGLEAPIAFYSRTLSAAERNYSQLDKEALALVASVHRFHEYVFGRSFTLVTDHKPLLGMLAGDRQTPAALSPRLIRWSIKLAAYSYVLVHRPGAAVGNADALSRSPVPARGNEDFSLDPPLLVDCISPSLISSTEIAKGSLGDPQLRAVVGWVKRGWPARLPDAAYKPYFTRRDELAVQAGCLLWGDRVVVPASLRNSVLATLHQCHPGIVRMKALARSFVWWPSLDKDVEALVAGCGPCQRSRADPPRTFDRVWERPRAPWSRVHVDFAGPYHGHSMLIVIDAYSKWMEVRIMASTTAAAVARALTGMFVTHGLPDTLVSDNGPQFTAVEFEGFLAARGIRHALSAPGHPQSNGLAERAVRSLKEALRRLPPSNLQEQIDLFLTWQHITPTRVTGKSPAELLFGRKLRSILDRMHPEYASPASGAPSKEPRAFVIGDLVWAKNLGIGPKWEQGEITDVKGPCSYIVQLQDNRVWRRHVDQLRPRSTSPISETETTSSNTPLPSSSGFSSPEEEDDLPGFWAVPSGTRVVESSPSGGAAGSGNEFPEEISEPVPASTAPINDSARNDLRKSQRPKRRPGYLSQYDCS